jgi:hypothetical protein
MKLTTDPATGETTVEYGGREAQWFMDGEFKPTNLDALYRLRIPSDLLPGGEWVSVDKELPEKAAYYWVLHSQHGVVQRRYSPLYQQENEFTSWITHWFKPAPLPPPPQPAEKTAREKAKEAWQKYVSKLGIYENKEGYPDNSGPFKIVFTDGFLANESGTKGEK